MIRQIREDDIYRGFLPLMAEVEAGSWFDMANPVYVEWLRQRISRRIGRGGKFYAMYSDDGLPLGIYCLLIEDHPVFPGHAEILGIGIFEGHRRQGLGSRLLEDAAQRSDAADACCIYVSTYAGDADAIAFYTQAGFTWVAELPRLNGPLDRGQVFMMKGLGQQSNGGAAERLRAPNS